MGYMSTVMTSQISSQNSADTEQLGERIGTRLRGGEVIELVSDLGGGKTTLTRGIVRGAGSKDVVASPTFTISREYTTPQFHIIHFDLYRLAEAGVVANELAEYLGDNMYVTIVEWADVAQDVLPTERLRIAIRQTGGDARDIECTYPESLAHLMEQSA